MTPLLEQLRELCRQHPLREKIVVVPSLAIGHQLGDALARSGSAWVNLRFETVRTLADAVAGFAIASEGLKLLSRAQALAIVERACDRVLDDSSYFASLRGSPGLHRAIQRSLDDLRLAGMNGSLPAAAFEDDRKAADLARILDAYEEELRDRRLVDRCGVVARAISMLENNHPTPWPDAVWLGAHDVELAHEESRLVALASRDAVKVRLAGTRDDAASMPRLRDVRFVSARGEENEIRSIFRMLLRNGSRFDDAEVVYTAADPYLPLVYELCAEHSIDATFAEGIAVSFTSPGQASLAFLRWCGDGWNAADIAIAAREGLLTADGVAPATLARILRTAAIGWGRERYEPQLLAHIASAEEIGNERGAKVREERVAALEFVRRLLDTTRELDVDPSGIVRANAIATACEQFVGEFARTSNERDGMAAAALRRMFSELADLPDSDVPLAEGCARLREAVLALHTAASNPRPGHLHVAPLRSGAWSGRTRLFLVGVGDARFPGAGLQDPIILDAEREGLNRRITPRQLPLLGESPLRASERLRRCLARAAGGTWTISFSSTALREQKESFPANDLLDIYRVARVAPDATYDDLLEEAIESGFIDSESPLGASEWWLGQRFIVRRPDYRELLHESYRWLARGGESEEARQSQQLTRWDGAFDLDPREIDPRSNGRILSASQIEKMASCPYGWFLRSVLRIEPPEELVRNPEVWLEPRHFGSLLHEVFEKALTEICATGAKPNLARDLPRTRAIAEEALARWRAKIPPPNEAAYLRQRDDVFETCRSFLKIEQSACEAGAEPMYFEAPFGFPDAGEHPIGMVEPLTIDLGRGRAIKVRGRIDRVDRLPNGHWAIWDYKTGSIYKWRGGWTFDAGRKVQHAIYSRALPEMLRRSGVDANAVVDQSGYLFPTPKGGGERIAKQHADGELERVLNHTFDLIASGFFAHPEEEEDCRFCDFAEICGGREAATRRAAGKYEANESSERVRLWRDLRSVR